MPPPKPNTLSPTSEAPWAPQRTPNSLRKSVVAMTILAEISTCRMAISILSTSRLNSAILSAVSVRIMVLVRLSTIAEPRSDRMLLVAVRSSSRLRLRSPSSSSSTSNSSKSSTASAYLIRINSVTSGASSCSCLLASTCRRSRSAISAAGHCLQVAYPAPWP